MAEMPFPAKNCDTRSEEYVGALSRINERSLHNSPRLHLMASIHLHVECLIDSGPFGEKLKVDNTPDVEKQINIVLILDFDILGLGEFFDLHSMDWRLA
jgi:hypothetical protein